MYLAILNGEIIYIYSSVPVSYIYLSYHRGDVSSIHLSTSDTTFCSKTSLHIKFHLSLLTGYSFVIKKDIYSL